MFFSKFSQIALHTENKLSFHNTSCPTAISPAFPSVRIDVFRNEILDVFRNEILDENNEF